MEPRIFKIAGAAPFRSKCCNAIHASAEAMSAQRCAARRRRQVLQRKRIAMQTTSTAPATQLGIDQEIDRLAKTWIFAQKLGAGNLGYERHSWAIDQVIDLAFHEPQKLWRMILRILEIDSSETIVSAVGAGPLEDLMVQHGEALIDKVEARASMSPPFKSAMQSVWLEDGDTAVCKKFFAIAGVAPPSRGRRSR
jgi:hypothetical protein